MDRVIAVLALLMAILTACSDGSGVPSSPPGGSAGSSGPDGSDVQAVTVAVDFQGTPVSYYNQAVQGASAGEDRALVVRRDSSEPLQVLDYGPRGTVSAQLRRPVVYVTFSEPMVPLAQLQRPSRESSLMTISPAVSGTFRWYGTRVLAFVPDQPLPGQREYRVTVSPDALSLNGRYLQEPLQFSFQDEPLRLRSLQAQLEPAEFYLDQSELPPQRARRLMARFNYPVTPAELDGRLVLRVAGVTSRFAVSPGDEESAVVLTLLEMPSEDSPITVSLGAGAPVEVHTITPFRFDRLSSYVDTPRRSPRQDTLNLSLLFSHPVDPASVATAVRVVHQGEALTLPVQPEVWERNVQIRGIPLIPGDVVELHMSPELTDRYGRSLVSEETVALTMPPAGSYALFPESGPRILEAQFPPRVIWEYQNITEARWSAAALDDPYAPPTPTMEQFSLEGQVEHQSNYHILDLTPWLDANGLGAVGLSWDVLGLPNRQGRRNPIRSNLQVQVTDLGITVRHAFNRLAILVSSLSTGAPVAGATVELRGTSLEGRTDSRGFLALDLPEPLDDQQIHLLVRHGEDRLHFVPDRSHDLYRFGFWMWRDISASAQQRMETYLILDRDLYRPGEEVLFRGIDRTWDPRLGDYLPYTGPYRISLEEQRWNGTTLASREGRTSPSGGFYGDYTLPEGVPPGDYRLVYRRQPDGGERGVPFRVAHVQRLDYEVNLQPAREEVLRNEPLEVGVTAQYLGGGALGGGAYSFHWERQPYFFRPPGERWSRWTFGSFQEDPPAVPQRGEAVLDRNGRAVLALTRDDGAVEGTPRRYTLEVRLSDQTGQEVAARTSVVEHPAAFYLGAVLEGPHRHFVSAGEPVAVRVQAVSPTGEEYSRGVFDVEAQLVRQEWRREVRTGATGGALGRWELHEEVVDRRSATDGVQFTPDRSGSWVVRLRGRDSAGGVARTDLHLYVAGSGLVQWGEGDQGEIRLLPDREGYAVGDTARIFVQSPAPEGMYLLTVERDGIIEERPVQLHGSAAVVEIPIREEHLPVVYVTLSAGQPRQAPPTSYFLRDTGKPQGLFGITRISVDPEPRTLTVEISPDRSDYQPGDEAMMTVSVLRRGEAVSGAEVTLLGVDRGVVDLTGYTVEDPIAFFYDPERFPPGVMGADSRARLLDPVVWELRDLAGGDGKGDVREEFPPLAVFEPAAITGEDGTVRIRFEWPDTLTTYRMTAVAVNENAFGRATRDVLVQSPLNVRLAIPSEIRLRDTLHASVVVTNLTAREQAPVITMTARGLEVPGEPTRQPRIPPGTTVVLDYPLAAMEAGDGQVVVTVDSAVLSETLVQALPVRRPAIVESVAATGRLREDEPVREGLVLPRNEAVRDGFLQVDINPTRAVHLDLLSRQITAETGDFHDLVAMRAIAQTVVDGGSSSGEVRSALAMLKAGQREDGGLGYLADSRWSSLLPSLWTGLLLTYLPEAERAAGPDAASLMHYIETGLRRGRGASLRDRAFGGYVLARLGAQAVVLPPPGADASLIEVGFAALTAAQQGRWDQFAVLRDRMGSYVAISGATVDLVDGSDGSSVLALALLLLVELQVLEDDQGEMVRRIANSMRSVRRPAERTWALLALSELVSREAGEQVQLNVTADLSGDRFLDRSF